MAVNRTHDFRKWQYSWEALSQIKILRLYLIHPSLSPIADCLQLTASMCPPDYAHLDGLSLLIQWEEEPKDNINNVDGYSYSHSLRVRVPPVVLDHSIPVQYKAMIDHIEVKLVLMLAMDHPLLGSLSSLLGSIDGISEETQSSFSLNNDTEALVREGEVHFYCKNCSARLTKEPLRFFKELPSVDWRDVADNWFGTCCCSFGGVSQMLVSNFEKFSCISKGTCFVGNTSITVRMDEIIRDAIIERGMRIAPNNDGPQKQSGKKFESEMNSSFHDVPLNCNLTSENLAKNQKHICDWKSISCHNIVEKVGTLLDTGGNAVSIPEKKEKNRNDYISVLDLLHEQAKTENTNFSYNQESEIMVHDTKNEVGILASDMSSLSCKDTNESISIVDPSLQSINAHYPRFPTFVDPVLNCKDNSCAANSRSMPTSQNISGAPEGKIFLNGCGGNDSENALSEQNKITSGSQYERTNTFSFYHGNGFMMGPYGVSNTVEWFSVHCSSCKSLIGSHPDLKGKPVSANEIIQLFKCHISTNEAVGGFHDVFRRHTLQRIFVNQLEANAEDESSYRTVIRDLKTKIPMLQMVLVNTKIWFCSANCCEMDMQSEDSASIQDLLEYDSKDTCLTDAKASKITSDSSDKGYDCTNLVAVVKVLFRDCSSHTPDESRAINEWALLRQAEDIFMLEEEIKAITEALMEARLKLPASCSSLEGFYLSFLEK
ncbi:hypothetical protein SUGI_0356440 [Cryptomeria japonica]|uniref:uncharacterized protein LOC131046151 n=1 Tax=Cryptomeria japonica TaxID=3369 RepID=UPI002408BA01|nr:uncharacterized protein LOC131046151 [Cryptomeria japonica]GLJ19679.1 hypothetical protein SUGI_0356440 [Cryptomeria japonica]